MSINITYTLTWLRALPLFILSGLFVAPRHNFKWWDVQVIGRSVAVVAFFLSLLSLFVLDSKYHLNTVLIATPSSLVLNDIFERNRGKDYDNNPNIFSLKVFRADVMGGKVDHPHFILLFGLVFEYDILRMEYRFASEYYSPSEVINLVDKFWTIMDHVNVKGYIDDEALRIRFMMDISRHLYTMGYVYRELGNAELTYSMWYNFIFVTFYKLILDKIQEIKNIDCEQIEMDIDSKCELDELLCDLNNKKSLILSRLEQYIRMQFGKRGITLIQNSYCGFDTEYESLNEGKHLNFLISAQTAIQRRSIIKVPLYKRFDISYVHPLSSSISNIYKNKVDLINMAYKYNFIEGLDEKNDKRIDYKELFILNNSLKHSISVIRKMLFGSDDLLNSLIIERLKVIAGVENYYEDDKLDQVVFVLPLTSLATQIIFPEKGKYTFVELLEMCNVKHNNNEKFEFCSVSHGKNKQNTKFVGSGVIDPIQLGDSPEKFLLPVPLEPCDQHIYPSKYWNKSSLRNVSLPVKSNMYEDEDIFERSVTGFGSLIKGLFNIFRGGSSHREMSTCTSNMLAHVEATEDKSLLSKINLPAHVEATEPSNVKLYQALTEHLTVSYEDSDNVEVKVGKVPQFGNSLREDVASLVNEFYKLGLSDEPQKIMKWFDDVNVKPRCRRKLIFDNDTTVSLSIVKNMYIIAHNNASEFSMLQDFEELKNKISIVGKCFVSLGKPLRCEQSFVYIRDTMLLAPGGKQKLKDLGELYKDQGDFSKIEICKDDIEHMSAFLKRDPKAFEDYAIRDAVICLKHALAMETFNNQQKQLGIPLTLSSMGRNYVFEQWSKIFNKHLPYQISGEYMMGNPNEVQTPKGLFATGDVGSHMSYFIANYKGGRNESFMYGADNDTHWIDYDLVSAYTTGMTDLALPDYYNASLINPKEIDEWETEQFLTGYLMVNANFSFPSDVKYPSIPCYIDKTTTVYPLSGNGFLTGPEYILALNQGCKINIKSAFYIHPKTTNKIINKEKVVEIIKPFKGIINDVQAKRRTFKKGHINNLLYKEMGNGIYGNVVRGMADKQAFDSLRGQSFRVTGTALSNPILASLTTAFIRSVIGECLHNIEKLGGKIVSATTDGFITDIKNLEEKLLSLPQSDTVLIRRYRKLREELSNNPEALEIKSEGKGIISWTTRGQLGIDSKIVAATGFQRLGFTRSELVTLFKKTLGDNEKFFEFTRNSLRSAKDIFNKGGHVMMTGKDQIFRMFYDNRRKIIEPEGLDFFNYDRSNVLLDSKPLSNINECRTRRFLAKFPIIAPFNKNNTNRAKTSYRTSIEIGVRNFVKAYYSLNEKFGLEGNEFRHAKDLITFISGHKSTKGIKISPSSISNLKHRKLIWKPVPPTNDNIMFVHYIKRSFPNFREDLFLKSKEFIPFN